MYMSIKLKSFSLQQFYNSVQSLPGSVGQSPARIRAASVDDASSELAHLLQMDDTQGNISTG